MWRLRKTIENISTVEISTTTTTTTTTKKKLFYVGLTKNKELANTK